jgi:WD40 repeat protein
VATTGYRKRFPIDGRHSLHILAGVTRDDPAAPSIPDYELLREIGRGSYGTVWIARSVTGLFRAVKIVWRSSFPDPVPYEREFRGLKDFAAVSLAEPRLLALLHVGRNDATGFFYYVMELADDIEPTSEIDPERYVPKTLREVRKRCGRLPASETLALGVDLANALAGLHDHNLVHRDIKPSNIIFVSGVPKLADVGLVTSAATADESRSRVGNLGYMPPDFPGVAAADVYGLGKVLYELVTGRDHGDYPRLPANLYTFPDRKELLELNEVFIRACATDATRRYADAKALLEELRLLHAGKSVRRLRSAERHLARALRAVAVLGIVAVVAGGGAWIAWRVAEEEMTLRVKAEAERDAIMQKSIYAAALSRAQRALEKRDFGGARRLLLTAGKPDLRGFEWYALGQEAKGDPAEVLRAAGPTIIRVRVSPDARLIAVSSFGQTVTLWNSLTREETRRIDQVVDLAGFSTDGQWLVGTNKKLELQRWSVLTGEPDGKTVAGINRPLAAIGADEVISFVDGKGDTPHIVRRWNFVQGTEVERLVVPRGSDGARWDFYRAAVSADGKFLALALLNGRSQEARQRLQIFEFSTQRVLFDEPTNRRISALAFTAGGDRLAAAFGDAGEIGILSIETGRWLWRKSPGASQANSLAFSPDGRRIALGGRDSSIWIADAESGAVISEWRGHEAGVEDLSWCFGRLVSGGSSGDVRLWHTDSATARYVVDGLQRAPTGGRSLCMSAHGELVAVTDMQRGVRIFATDTLAELPVIEVAARPLVFTNNAKELWTLGRKGALQRWELRTSRLLQSFSPEIEHVPSYPCVSADGVLLFYGDAVGNLHWRDLRTGTTLATVGGHTGAVWWCALSQDGEVGFSSGEDRRLRMWNSVTQRELGVLNLRYNATHAAVSPAGNLLAVALANGTVELRQLPDLKLLRTLRTPNARLSAVTFSADGRRLWSAGATGDVTTYRTEDWQEVVDLTMRRAGIDGIPDNTPIALLGVDPSDSILCACTLDGRLRIWRK